MKERRADTRSGKLAEKFICWCTGPAATSFALTPAEYDRVCAARREPARRWCNIRGRRVYLCGRRRVTRRAGRDNSRAGNAEKREG